MIVNEKQRPKQSNNTNLEDEEARVHSLHPLGEVLARPVNLERLIKAAKFQVVLHHFRLDLGRSRLGLPRLLRWRFLSIFDNIARAILDLDLKCYALYFDEEKKQNRIDQNKKIIIGTFAISSTKSWSMRSMNA